jgi:hypothetical protein
LSLGLAFGGIIGLMPLWTPHNIFLIFLAFIINLNFALLIVGLPFMQAKPLDLNQYVTDEALSRLFIMMGKEETKIRTDPTTRATDLLKTNFWTIASRNLT